MTVQDMIDMLSDLPPDAELRVAHQPQHAFEYSVGEAMTSNFETGEDAEEATVVWITTGEQLRYLPGDVTNLLKGNGWH